MLCVRVIVVKFILLIALLFFIVMAPQYEMAVGLKKGHKVTKLQKQERPSRRRGVSDAFATRLIFQCKIAEWQFVDTCN